MVYKTIQTHVKGNILLRLLAFYGWCGRRFLEKPLNPKPSPPPKPVDFFVANFCTQIFTTCLMQLYFLITFWVRLVLYPAVWLFNFIESFINLWLTNCKNAWKWQFVNLGPRPIWKSPLINLKLGMSKNGKNAWKWHFNNLWAWHVWKRLFI